MNYLTNYYKNLSEQLQQKLTSLETEILNLNEDLTSDGGVGTIVQGYGTTNTSTTTNQNQNSDLNNFLQAWGSSNTQYDYNGDGVVDGNDLGIHLSRMLDRGRGGSTPQTMASTRAAEGTPGTPEVSGGGVKRVAALDQPGTEKSPLAAYYRAGAGTPTSTPRPNAPTVKKNTTKNVNNAPNIGGENLNQRTAKTPYKNLISLTAEKLAKEQETPTAYLGPNLGPRTEEGTNPNNGPMNFDFNGDGYIDSDEQGRFEDEYVSETDIADLNGDNLVNQEDYDLFINYIQQQEAQRNNQSKQSSSWTSQRTTSPDTLFYGQRRRPKK